MLFLSFQSLITHRLSLEIFTDEKKFLTRFKEEEAKA